MPYVMYLNCPIAQTAWVIVIPCVALWNHIAIIKHAMKYGVMSITNAVGTKKQLHCAHDAWVIYEPQLYFNQTPSLY